MKLIRHVPLLLSIVVWQAQAQTAAAPAESDLAPESATSSESPSPFGQPISSAALDTLRGGTSNTLNEMELNGTTANNTARDVTTGNNAISGGSFANLSGIPVVIQNTGANVLIQNAVILNLKMN